MLDVAFIESSTTSKEVKRPSGRTQRNEEAMPGDDAFRAVGQSKQCVAYLTRDFFLFFFFGLDRVDDFFVDSYHSCLNCIRTI